MKPDLILTWIKHTDYPIFRQFLTQYGSWFNKIIIYWSEHNRFPYYDHFIQNAIQRSGVTNAINLDPTETDWGTQDWRNVSTNYMLNYSDAEWVCSIEQDWFVKDWEKILSSIEKFSSKADLMGWWQENNNYIHPSFWFIKRETLDKTGKNFAAYGKHDHFGLITEDVMKNAGKIITLQDMGFNCNVSQDADCFHLGGVNQNYLEGLKEGYVFHRPKVFSAYNLFSLQAKTPQDPRHVELCDKISYVLPVPDMEWKEFFVHENYKLN